MPISGLLTAYSVKVDIICLVFPGDFDKIRGNWRARSDHVTNEHGKMTPWKRECAKCYVTFIKL